MDINGDSVVVVTGGASGIGLGMAHAFASRGASIVLADIEGAALSAAAAELRAAGAAVLDVITDVSRQEDLDALAARTIERFGRVDVLCNNAGVNGGAGPLWEIPLEEWTWIIGVNFSGVVHGLRSFVPIMEQQGRGHIVNTASMAAVTSMPVYAPYAASKHAVLAVSETLRIQLTNAGLAIGVTVVLPGLVPTNIRTAERNRPGDSADRSATDPEPYPADAALVSAAEVGQMVVRAVADGTFLLPTHVGSGARARPRLDEIGAAFDAFDRWSRE